MYAYTLLVMYFDYTRWVIITLWHRPVQLQTHTVLTQLLRKFRRSRNTNNFWVLWALIIVYVLITHFLLFTLICVYYSITVLYIWLITGIWVLLTYEKQTKFMWLCINCITLLSLHLDHLKLILVDHHYHRKFECLNSISLFIKHLKDFPHFFCHQCTSLFGNYSQQGHSE